MRRRQEETMNQDQAETIARILYRISDNMERDEVTREIAGVLKDAVQGFNEQHFYELANVAYLENR
jgi:hypothetical protein